MTKMRNFSPTRLPDSVRNSDYRHVIEKVRRWAGPSVFLGDAGLLTPRQEDYLPLAEQLDARALDLGLCVYELAGSRMIYTATVPEGLGYSGSLQVAMSADDAGDVWVTSMSAIGAVAELAPDLAREVPAHIQIARSKWRFRLSQNARALAVAAMLEERGVEHDTDTESLIERIDSGIRRTRARSSTAIKAQRQ